MYLPKSLTDYYISNKISPQNPYTRMYFGSIPDEITDFVELCKSPSIKKVLMIGIDTGHMNELILKYNPNCVIYCFEEEKSPNLDKIPHLLKYTILKYGKRQRVHITDLDLYFKYHKSTHSPENSLFDLIIINGDFKGNYSSEKYLKYIKYAKEYSKNDTILLLNYYNDSFILREKWTILPTNIWKSLRQNNQVVSYGHYFKRDGRGYVWGKFR